MSIFESLENLNVSEECFDDIIAMVEELILERNKENKQAKREWELNKGKGYHTDYLYDDDDDKESNKYYKSSKEHTVKSNQNAIHGLKKYVKDANPPAVNHAVDQLGRSNRVILGREQNPVSYRSPSEHSKNYSQDDRKEQSQRGSAKDPYTRVGSPEEMKEPGSVLKRQEERKKK